MIREFRTVWPDLAVIFARWRNENPTMSSDKFIATCEGTAQWLDNMVISRDDRILFLILSLDGVKIGHIGYSSFNYEEKCCEVDAVLRGEKLSMPGMMTCALGALIHWGLNDLQLENIRLRVFDDNLHAIDFYKRNCFSIIEENCPVENCTEKTYTVMQLQKSLWNEKNRRECY